MPIEWLKNGAAAEKEENEEYWISVSDLMSGLMIIFLFIALSYMIDVVKQRDLVEDQRDDLRIQRDQMREIAQTWNTTQRRVYERLLDEFHDDLPKWKADIDEKTLAIRFNEPSIMFDTGKDDIKPEFAMILSDFFPRYMTVLTEFQENLEEVRIEGHTSTGWGAGTSADDAYILNMRLSQDRARAILQYCLALRRLTVDQRELAQRRLTANGLSSSRPRLLTDGEAEDKLLSRRVEFRVRTDAERRIIGILEAGR